MGIPPEVPIPCRILALTRERDRLFRYPPERLAREIRETGFRCVRCGMCCTEHVNRHIFLLDRDVAELERIDPGASIPAPDPEFCDQNGTLYVSGYALRMKGDGPRSCWFLDGRECRIYERRFSVCRVYPHMLRRTAGAGGRVSWQRFSRPGEHGLYRCGLSEGECMELAREIREYENAFLMQQISFLEIIREHFSAHSLWHDPRMHEARARAASRGLPARTMVFRAGELEEFPDSGGGR